MDYDDYPHFKARDASNYALVYSGDVTILYQKEQNVWIRNFGFQKFLYNFDLSGAAAVGELSLVVLIGS
jgi:hypothetical protein